MPKPGQKNRLDSSGNSNEQNTMISLEKALQAVVYAECRTFMLISFTVPNLHLPATP